MQPIRSYLIRIYRQDRSGLAGTIEDVRTGRRRPFQSLAELWSMLRGRNRQEALAATPPPDSPFD